MSSIFHMYITCTYKLYVFNIFINIASINFFKKFVLASHKTHNDVYAVFWSLGYQLTLEFHGNDTVECTSGKLLGLRWPEPQAWFFWRWAALF